MSKETEFDTSVFYLKSFKCPVCGAEFKRTQLKKNATRALKREEDLRASYSGVNPSHYGVILCESCGYAAMVSDFDALGEPAKKAVREQISSRWKERSYPYELELKDIIELHMIALLNYEIQKRKPSDLAKIAQRLSWFYRELGDEARSQKFEQQCLNLFKKAYIEENLDLNTDFRTTVYYLIGYYSYKNEDYREAAKMLREAIISNRHGRNMFVERLAQDRLEEVKSAYREAKNEGEEGEGNA